MFTRAVYALVSLKTDLQASFVPRRRVLCVHTGSGVRNARKCNTGAIEDHLRDQCTQSCLDTYISALSFMLEFCNRRALRDEC